MGLWERRKQAKARKKLNESAKPFFALWWNDYKDINCPERDALTNYMKAQRRGVEQASLLWEEGYKHGDHVLVYDPSGLFKEEIMTKFGGESLLMLPDMAAKFEEAQGNRVNPEDRTQKKCQPDFTSRETSWSDLLNRQIGLGHKTVEQNRNDVSDLQPKKERKPWERCVPNDNLPISLASFLILDIVPKLMERDIFGRTYIRLGRVLTLSIWLYETGAILGRLWKDKLALVVMMFEREEKRDDFTQFWRNEANKRLGLYEGQPHNFTAFVGETDLQLFDGKTFRDLLKVGNKKLNHKEGQERLRLAETSLIEGIMFGSTFPDLTHTMLVNKYEKINIDSWKDRWSEKPPQITAVDKEKEAIELARDYVCEYFPQLVEPLGLAGI